MCHRTAHSLGGNRWLAAAEADRQTDSAGISTGIWESKRHVDQAALYQTGMAVWVVVVQSKYINIARTQLVLNMGYISTNSTLNYRNMFDQRQKNPKENWELCI